VPLQPATEKYVTHQIQEAGVSGYNCTGKSSQVNCARKGNRKQTRSMALIPAHLNEPAVLPGTLTSVINWFPFITRPH